MALSALHIDPATLRSAGLPDHSINALYRALAAHAEGFDGVVAGELGELKRVLQQHGGVHAAAAVSMLSGPALEVRKWIHECVKEHVLHSAAIKEADSCKLAPNSVFVAYESTCQGWA